MERLFRFYKNNKKKIILPMIISILYVFLITLYWQFRLYEIFSLSIVQVCLVALIVLVVTVFLCYLCIYFLVDISFSTKFCRKEGSVNIGFWIGTVSTFLVMLFYLFAYFPGGFSPDSIDQYSQALCNTYNDWHPYIHTLIFFKFPLLVLEEPFTILFFQIIYYSLTVGYMIKTLVRFNAPKLFVGFSWLFILINPELCRLMLFPWKNVALIIISLIIMTQFCCIYLSEGAWIEKFYNAMAIGVMLAIGTLLRHNAILFTIPLLIAVVILTYKKIKYYSIMIVTFLSVCFIAKVPLYNYFQVEIPGYRTTEMVGLPMSIIANVVKNDPMSLDSEVLDFAYSVLEKDKWETYTEQGWNQLKWQGADREVIEETGVFQVLSYTINALKSSPYQAIRGAVNVTHILWDPLYVYVFGVDIYENNLGIISNYNERAHAMIDLLDKTLDFPTKIFNIRLCLSSVGLVMMIMLLAVSAKIIKDYKKILIIMPIFCYNFGTMLMLSGYGPGYFAYTIVLFPIVLYMIVAKIESNNMGF